MITAEQRYLEAIELVNSESFNRRAQKPYDELTEEQKSIDEYIAKKIQEVRDKFIERLKEELDWTNIEDSSGSWSPGEVKIIIDKLAGEENEL